MSTKESVYVEAERTVMENSIAISNPAEATEPKPSQDNFYTPANQAFYASNPYSELDPSKRNIRLLEILHANDGTPLRLKLLAPFSLSLGESPRYCAISYFAGNHKETEVIYVDGIQFNAFANLAHALRQVATARERGDLTDYPPLIWADQICINQSSPVERSHQVGFMREIYESAQVVFASLGWTDPTAGRWVEAAKRLVFKEAPALELRGSLIYNNNRVLADFYGKDFSEDLMALGHMLGSQWWRRGWVYQEIVSAQDVIILFGNSTLEWDGIFIVAQVFQSVYDRLFSSWVQEAKPLFDDRDLMFTIDAGFNSRFASFMIESRIDWGKGYKKEAVELLIYAQECSFTDPRDRIYAFVGLIDPGYGMIPNYQIDTPGTIRLACKRIILFKRRLDVLCCSIPGTDLSDCKRRGDIPSWTADWTSRTGNFNFIYDFKADLPPFRASSDYPSAASFHPYDRAPDSILRTQCIFIDQLSNRTTAGYQDLPNRADTLDEWARVAGISSAFGKVESDDLGSERYPFNNSITPFDAFPNVVLRGSSKVHDESYYHDSQNSTGWASNTTDNGILFRSHCGYLGVTKKHVELQEDDLICILLGANVPFILRKICDHYVLVGDAYVEGLMHGEGVKLMQQGAVVVETIDIH